MYEKVSAFKKTTTGAFNIINHIISKCTGFPECVTVDTFYFCVWVFHCISELFLQKQSSLWSPRPYYLHVSPNCTGFSKLWQGASVHGNPLIFFPQAQHPRASTRCLHQATMFSCRGETFQSLPRGSQLFQFSRVSPMTMPFHPLSPFYISESPRKEKSNIIRHLISNMANLMILKFSQG